MRLCTTVVPTNVVQSMPHHSQLLLSICHVMQCHVSCTTSIYIRIHPKIFRNFRPRLQMFRLDSPVVPPPDKSHVLATRLGTIQHQTEHLDHNQKIESGHKSNSINRISPKLGNEYGWLHIFTLQIQSNAASAPTAKTCARPRTLKEW